MRVLHVLNELRPSGAEMMLRSAGAHWKVHGVECDLLSTGPRPGPFSEQLAAAGYRIHHIPFSISPGFFVQLSRLLRSNDYDVVHMHAERNAFSISLTASAVGIRRLVRTVHNNFKRSGTAASVRKIQRSVMRRLGVTFVAVSPSVTSSEHAYYMNATALIPNWFDSQRFVSPSRFERARTRSTFSIAQETYVIVSVGNCSPQKNHSMLIHALARLARPNGWKYLHVGAEEAGMPERALAAALGLEHRIDFLGARQDVYSLLVTADLYVMPSTHEGASIAALEALGVGVPAVLTNVPGLADLRSDFPGIAFAEPNIEDLRRAIDAAMAMPDAERQQLSAGLATAARSLYSVARGVSQYVTLYRNNR